MKIETGDKVRFLNDVGGGVVTKYKDKNTVMVLTDDEFEVPALLTNLVIVEKGEKQERAAQPQSYVEDLSYNYSDREDEFEEMDNSSISKELNILLGFEEAKGGMNAHLINDSDYWLLYHIIVNYEDSSAGILSGKLEDNTKMYITHYELDDIKNIKSFTFQIIPYRNGKYMPVKPIDKEIVIKPVKFYTEGSFKENDYFDANGILFTIEDTVAQKMAKELSKEDVQEIIKQKQESDDYQKKLSQKFTSRQQEQLREVDLHIHELLDNTAGLENVEMLEVQMNHFRTEMEKAIKERVLKVVFIHGVGNGTLKHELRKTLEKDYKKYPYQDASFKEYGFGATMVVLRRK